VAAADQVANHISCLMSVGALAEESNIVRLSVGGRF